MLNHTDFVKWLARDYDYIWKSGRLIEIGVAGYIPNKDHGRFSSATEVVDFLAPRLAKTDFMSRYLERFGN